MAPDKVFTHTLPTGTVILKHVAGPRRSDGGNTRLRATFEASNGGMTYYGKFTWAELDRQLIGPAPPLNDFIIRHPTASVTVDNVTLEFEVKAAGRSLILDLWPSVAESTHRMSQTMAEIQAELASLRARFDALANDQSADTGSVPTPMSPSSVAGD
jgi:hypothetical protein